MNLYNASSIERNFASESSVKISNNLFQWIIENSEAELNESKQKKTKQSDSNIPTNIKKWDTSQTPKVIGPAWRYIIDRSRSFPDKFLRVFEIEIPGRVFPLIRSAS